MSKYSNLKNPLSRRIQNISRGASNYNTDFSRTSARYIIDKLFLSPTQHRVGFLKGYHAAKLLKIQTGFKNLTIMQEDTVLWDKVLENKSLSFKENILLFATSYVAGNEEQVFELQDFCNQTNKLLFEGKLDDLKEFLAAQEGLVAQSICFLRTYMAAFHKSPNELLAKLSNDENSHFVSKMISRILVAANTYTGSDQSVDDILTMFNADFGKDDIKTYAVNLILGKTEGDLEHISRQLFLALRSHPYDMRELLLTYFETKISNELHFTILEKECLQIIHSSHSCCRSKMLHSIMNEEKVEYLQNGDNLSLLKSIGVAPETHEIWVKLFSDAKFQLSGPTGHNFLDALIRMRNTRFPSETHYREVESAVHRYKHLCFGRMLRGFFSGLYLMRRTSRSIEIRDSLRVISYWGKLTNFVLTSPRGISASRIMGHSAKFHLRNLKLVDYGKPASDRYQLKNDMWKLKTPEYVQDYLEWFRLVKELVIYKEPYYTGISWELLDVIEREHRIDAFKGNPDAYYALLIWLAETKTRTSTRLRIAIKLSDVKYGSFLELLEALTENFGQSIHLFLTEFCSPQTILKMKFADTYVEALTMRFHGMYQATKKVGYSDYLSANQLRHEESAFVANALLSSIGKNRFSVGWEMFKSDFLRRKESAFKNIFYFINEDSDSLSNDVVKTDLTQVEFDNGFVKRIPHCSHKEYLCDKVLIDLFDSFISHPSQGIEAILSIRIRHIHFRKEFADVFSDLKAPGRDGLTMHEKREMTNRYEAEVLSLIVDWSKARMATFRQDKPDAIFNIFPEDDEAWNVLRATIDFTSLESAIDGFIEWMTAKLDQNLLSARDALTNDLMVKIEDLIKNLALPAGQSQISSVHKKVSEILTSAIRQKTNLLLSWFRIPAGDILDGLTTFDIRELAYKNYFRERKQGKLKILISNEPIDALNWGDSEIRLAYYLLLELVENAIKYGCSNKTSISIVPYSDDANIGVIVSNRCDSLQSTETKKIRGHPNIATQDIFEEGDTGLKKIAALSASLLGEETDILAFGYNSIFRLKIPLARNYNG